MRLLISRSFSLRAYSSWILILALCTSICFSKLKSCSVYSAPQHRENTPVVVSYVSIITRTAS